MCIHLTSVLYCITTVLIEVYHLCLFESVCLRERGKPTSRVEINGPSFLYLKAVKGAPLGSALAGATSELTNSNRKKNPHKTHYSLLRKRLRASIYNFILFSLIKFRKRERQPQQIIKKIKTKILELIK